MSQIKSDKEHCVLCGTQTKFDKKLHIDFKTSYIEGVGQVCPKCLIKLKNK